MKYKQKLLCSVATAALLTTVGVAGAADLTNADPVVKSSQYEVSWSGFTYGLHTGWGAGHSQTRADYDDEWMWNNTDISGGMLGVQVGYDFDMMNGLVLGVGASASATDINGFAQDEYCIDDVECSGLDETKVDILASVTGRVGWNGNDPSTLYYARGGLAFAHAEFGWVPSTYDYSYTGSTWRHGWTVGAGIEKALPFWKNATAFLEYDYYDFGSWDGVSNNSDYNVDSRFDIHAIKFGLNFRPGAWNVAQGMHDDGYVADNVNWTGFTYGVHTGWGAGHSQTRADYDDEWMWNNTDISGGMLGVQVGYDFDMMNGLVLGVGASASATDINGFAQDEYCIDDVECSGLDETKVDILASVTGRVGWNGNDPSTLYYARGGLAFAHAEFGWVPSTYDYSYTGSTWRHGWTVGAGIEKALPFWKNATAFLEYDYYDFGSWDGVSNNSDYNVDAKFDIHAIKFGINIKVGKN